MSTFTLGYFKYICIYLSIILNAGLGEKLYVVAAFTEVKDLSVSYSRAGNVGRADFIFSSVFCLLHWFRPNAPL